MTVNYYGDQYKWFEGVVEDRDDPLKLGRVKVRIFGLHTAETQHIPTQLLPWASVMMPVSSASLNGLGHTPTGIVEGTRVVGFFRDGESAQDPLVIGTLPGVSNTPKYQTRSTAITTPGEREAVYNNGVDPTTGELVEPIKQIELNKNLDINLLIIHCAATKPSMDIGAKEIDQWHKQRGWSKIGYHLVIRRNGVVEKGREIGETGAHAQGYNRKSVGVCMVGGVDDRNRPDDNFTHAQWEQLKTIVGKFIEDYPGIKVIGHNEVAAKACPSFDVQAWLAKIFPDAQVGSGGVKPLADNTPVEPSYATDPTLPVSTDQDKQKYLGSLALVESSGDPNATSPTGAAGLYQFTEGTWKDTTKAMGKNYPLEDRYDPEKSTEVAEFFTNRQQAQLENNLGRDTTSTDLYTAHFMGVNGATKHIRALEEDPNQSAAAINPNQARANPSIYYDAQGNPRSVQQVTDILGNKVNKAEQAVDTGRWGEAGLPTTVRTIVGEPKKALATVTDFKFDAGETEAFADDIAKGAAVVNPKYIENQFGFIDPNGTYPREQNIGEPDTNRLGRNDASDINGTVVSKKTAAVVTNVPTAIPDQVWSEPVTPYNAQYPFNHVTETESGHIIELDDTPGKERIHEYHKSGTFRELHPNGTRVEKIVKDNYTIIAGNDYVLIEGTVNITVNGNATLNVAGHVAGKVGGDLDLEIEGEMSIKSKGNAKLHSDGDMFITTGGILYEN